MGALWQGGLCGGLFTFDLWRLQRMQVIRGGLRLRGGGEDQPYCLIQECSRMGWGIASLECSRHEVTLSTGYLGRFEFPASQMNVRVEGNPWVHNHGSPRAGAFLSCFFVRLKAVVSSPRPDISNGDVHSLGQ